MERARDLERERAGEQAQEAHQRRASLDDRRPDGETRADEDRPGNVPDQVGDERLEAERSPTAPPSTSSSTSITRPRMTANHATRRSVAPRSGAGCVVRLIRILCSHGVARFKSNLSVIAGASPDPLPTPAWLVPRYSWTDWMAIAPAPTAEAPGESAADRPREFTAPTDDEVEGPFWGGSFRPFSHSRDVLYDGHAVGLMFWLRRKRLVGIVLVLEGDEPLVVLAVGVAHQLLPLLQEAGEVQVHAAVGEAPHVGDAVPRPGYVRLVVSRLLPVGLDAEQDGRAPVAEGALAAPTGPWPRPGTRRRSWSGPTALPPRGR